MNKTTNLVTIVNKIINLAEIGSYSPLMDRNFPSFVFGENTISFVSDNFSEYTNAISTAFDLDKDIKNTYTLKEYQDLLISHFGESILNETLVKENDVALFETKLKDKTLKTFSVFRKIYGIILRQGQDILSLGKYRIYDFDIHKNAIASKANMRSLQLLPGDNSPKYLIECEVKARTCSKAFEIADEYFEQFELILSFMIGGTSINDFEVSILSYQGWSQQKAFMIYDGGFSQSSNLIGLTKALPLDDPFFSSEKDGCKTIWELTKKDNVNKFQRRIILAIEWIGQSITEKSPQIAFLKAAIALEIIFTYSEKNIITPSILNQISESTALILGTSKDKRIEIESKVKKLYGLRSKIVHSGNKNTKKEDHEHILRIARGIVIKLVTADLFKNIDSVENLYKALKEVKYSGDSIL